MSNLTYTLPAPGKLMSHGDSLLLMLRDDDESDDRLELTAQVRSGDYLETLATALDSISNTMTEGNEPEAAILQKHVDNLLYLARKYQLVKK